MAAGRGRLGLGWIILAAALVVPGFLFYNWWSHLKVERDHLMSAQPNKRLDHGVFQTPLPATSRLVNPIVSSMPTASTAPVAAPHDAPPAAKVIAQPKVEVSTSSVSSAIFSRDPMMSPSDSARLRQMEIEEEKRQKRLEAEKHRRQENKNIDPLVMIAREIELQGIIAQPNGDNRAIINGSIVGQGKVLSVAHYAGKIRIVKINASDVTLEYNGRKFKLRLSTH